MADTARSHVECLGSERSRCGYCRTRYTSRNFGVWAHRLDVRDYQALLDAGWRRSGLYLYRPDLVTTCCPCFVIRLDAARFSPSSTHKRVLKRLRRFAADPALPHSSSAVSSAAPPSERQPTIVTNTKAPGIERMREIVSSAISATMDTILDIPKEAANFVNKETADAVRNNIKVFPPRQVSKSKLKKRKSKEDAAAPAENTKDSHQSPMLMSNVALLLSAAERKRREATTGTASQTSDAKGRGISEKGKRTISNSVKQVQVKRQMELANILAKHIESSIVDFGSLSVTEPGFLNFWWSDQMMEKQDAEMMHDSIRTEKPMEIDEKRTTVLKEQLRSVTTAAHEQFHASFSAAKIPLSRVGSDVSSERTGGPSGYPSPDVPDNPVPLDDGDRSQDAVTRGGRGIVEELSEGKSFTMELAPSEFSLEAYEVFRKYQMAIHREPASQCSEDTYRRFLVDSPLVQAQSPLDPEQWYGTFHMMYRIHGRLFAVGVVDVLPRCLSSVYLFYDPEFAKLSPGTLSAVKEIEWVKRASIVFPTLRFYYMGYYIHSCAKMRYKAGFHPSEILCEETKNWIPATDAQAILESAEGRQLRLAPPSMAAAPEASNFHMEESELDQLTTESKLSISFGQDGVRIISFSTLSRLLSSTYREQIDALQLKIRKFVELVGKASSKFYLHDV